MARYGGRPTAEGSLALDLYKLMRDGMCAPRKYGSGTIHWSTNGIRTGSMGFESALGDDRGFIRLRYTSTLWTGEKHASDYRIELTTREQPFGGKRWFFICPKTGARVWKLYLPSGAVTFASRRHYRLGYRCQREGSHDRDINRAFKLRRRLGSDDGLDAPIEKPKGMHWKTYDREMRKIRAAEAATLPWTIALLQRLSGLRAT